jgi:RHS repeat-associated protein
MTLADASGNGAKTWSFMTTATATYPWQVGLITDFRQLATTTSTNAITHDEYTWSRNAASIPYISAKTSIKDEGTSNAQSALSTQTQDQYGNTTQSVIYPYNNTSTPLATYNNTYLDDSGTYSNPFFTATYIEHYIRNRLTTSTITSALTGGVPVTLATNVYDESTMSGAGSGYELDSSPPLQYYQRGMMSNSITPTKSGSMYYDPTGNVYQAYASDGSTYSASTSSTTNYAAPSTITSQSYSTSVTYNSCLGITQTTGQNGEQLQMAYDGRRRPTSGTSPYGAVTSYTYTAPGTLPVTQTKTGPDGYTQTTLDGVGRTIKVLRGPSSSLIQSEVDTVYAPCACSPLAKLQKTSQPYAPGGTPVWTTYTYDGIGRTLTVTQPDGASTTTYSYSGNQTTVTDPAGNWKTLTTDVLGNLIAVVEPDPANQPGGTLTTTYTYDWMNHVTGVTMTRAGTTQTRSFVYDNAGRLTSATNPENGTVTYTYNSDNTLQDKHDARGQDTVYTYDSLKRLTMIKKYPTGRSNSEDTCQRVTYSYDTNPYSSTFTQNGYGRRTAAQYLTGTCSVGVGLNITEMYSYHAAGAVTQKNIAVAGVSTTLTAVYTYNTAGQLSTLTYPTTSNPLQYGYDSMARLNSLVQTPSGGQVWVQNVAYDLASRMTSIQYASGTSAGYPSSFATETMSYNVNGRLVSLNWGPSGNFLSPAGGIQYNYSATQNNGQITQAVDTITGETISYQYDQLKRLTSASSTPISGFSPAPSAYTETFQYDGFGNLTAKVLNGTTQPIAVNASTNQLSSAYYDANGNMTSGAGATLAYDVSNRLAYAQETGGGIEYYGYAPDNKRVFRQLTSGQQQFTFYGARGEKLGVYSISGGAASLISQYVWFGRKLIFDGNPVYPDRLGTNRSSGASYTSYSTFLGTAGAPSRYLPYGDELTSTPNDHVKFGTYNRDSYTGLDYADQRFYASTYGRFMTPDPYGGSARSGSPLTWNRYSYVMGDPVNHSDRRGLDCDPYSGDPCNDENNGIGNSVSSCDDTCIDDQYYAANPTAATPVSGPVYDSDTPTQFSATGSTSPNGSSFSTGNSDTTDNNDSSSDSNQVSLIPISVASPPAVSIATEVCGSSSTSLVVGRMIQGALEGMIGGAAAGFVGGELFSGGLLGVPGAMVGGVVGGVVFAGVAALTASALATTCTARGAYSNRPQPGSGNFGNPPTTPIPGPPRSGFGPRFPAI